jgi:hypothetical protein
MAQDENSKDRQALKRTVKTLQECEATAQGARKKRDVLVKRLYDNGVPVAELATLTGMTNRAVYDALDR